MGQEKKIKQADLTDRKRFILINIQRNMKASYITYNYKILS